jgi:hypothetical protein
MNLAINKNKDIMREIDVADRVLVSMQNRRITNKVLFYGIMVLIVGGILLVLYKNLS